MEKKTIAGADDKMEIDLGMNGNEESEDVSDGEEWIGLE